MTDDIGDYIESLADEFRAKGLDPTAFRRRKAYVCRVSRRRERTPEESAAIAERQQVARLKASLRHQRGGRRTKAERAAHNLMLSPP